MIVYRLKILKSGKKDCRFFNVNISCKKERNSLIYLLMISILDTIIVNHSFNFTLRSFTKQKKKHCTLQDVVNII